MMKLVNLTAHPINIWMKDNSVITIPKANNGNVVRIAHKQITMAQYDGIPVMQTTYYDADCNLPATKPDTVYIVSSIVAMSNPFRHDLVSPNTHPDQVVRDQRTGKIIGVRSLQSFWRGE